MKKQGFTVWELLAVIIIILVVAAILFPVFAKARHPRSHFTCASNEKLLGLAIAQYVQDNDEQMPNIADAKDKNITWRVMVYLYGKSKMLYQCPGRADTFNGPDGLPRSYAANYTGTYSGRENDNGDGIFAGPGSKPVTLADIDHPASLIALCEVWHSHTPDFNIDNLGVYNPTSDSLWAGHTDGGNYLLADGHEKYLKPLETKDLWHRNASIPLSAGSIKVLSHAHKADEK